MLRSRDNLKTMVRINCFILIATTNISLADGIGYLVCEGSGFLYFEENKHFNDRPKGCIEFFVVDSTNVKVSKILNSPIVSRYIYRRFLILQADNCSILVYTEFQCIPVTSVEWSSNGLTRSQSLLVVGTSLNEPM